MKNFESTNGCEIVVRAARGVGREGHTSRCNCCCRERELLSEREAVYQHYVDKQQYMQLIKALRDRVRVPHVYA